MTDHAVTPLRRRTTAAYTDTAALNDIHAVLTTEDPGTTVLADIAAIVTRTGRPMVAGRDIEISTTETPLGWPVACTQAGDTSVFVRQQPHGPGLLVEVVTKTAAECQALTITLDGTPLHPAAHPGSTPA